MNYISKISRTSFWLLLAAFTLGLAAQANAQAYAQPAPRFEAGVDYSYVRSNTPPGGCACFGLNGGGGSLAYYFNRSLAAVADINSGHSSNIGIGTSDLTLTSYVFGPRYYWHNHSRTTPFVQALLGGAHANSNSLALRVAGQQTGSNAFASKIGGGVDLPLTQRFWLRPFEANYFLTHFNNGVNDHQNNLQIGAGVVLHFGTK
jgi:outer membrane immunogenic protein